MRKNDRDTLKHSVPVNIVKTKPTQMNVTDMATARAIRTMVRTKCLLEIRIVNIAKRSVYEMARTDLAIAVH